MIIQGVPLIHYEFQDQFLAPVKIVQCFKTLTHQYSNTFQVTSIVTNCHAQLRNIGKITQYLSSDPSTNLIHAFISSRFDYGNSLLFSLPDTHIQRLHKVQNTAARSRKYDHITPILEQLHWLTVKEQIDFKVLMLINI